MHFDIFFFRFCCTRPSLFVFNRISLHSPLAHPLHLKFMSSNLFLWIYAQASIDSVSLLQGHRSFSPLLFLYFTVHRLLRLDSAPLAPPPRPVCPWNTFLMHLLSFPFTNFILSATAVSIGACSSSVCSSFTRDRVTCNRKLKLSTVEYHFCFFYTSEHILTLVSAFEQISFGHLPSASNFCCCCFLLISLSFFNFYLFFLFFPFLIIFRILAANSFSTKRTRNRTNKLYQKYFIVFFQIQLNFRIFFIVGSRPKPPQLLFHVLRIMSCLVSHVILIFCFVLYSAPRTFSSSFVFILSTAILIPSVRFSACFGAFAVTHTHKHTRLIALWIAHLSDFSATAIARTLTPRFLIRICRFLWQFINRSCLFFQISPPSPVDIIRIIIIFYNSMSIGCFFCTCAFQQNTRDFRFLLAFFWSPPDLHHSPPTLFSSPSSTSSSSFHSSSHLTRIHPPKLSTFAFTSTHLSASQSPSSSFNRQSRHTTRRLLWFSKSNDSSNSFFDWNFRFLLLPHFSTWTFIFSHFFFVFVFKMIVFFICILSLHSFPVCRFVCHAFSIPFFSPLTTTCPAFASHLHPLSTLPASPSPSQPLRHYPLSTRFHRSLRPAPFRLPHFNATVALFSAWPLLLMPSFSFRFNFKSLLCIHLHPLINLS